MSRKIELEQTAEKLETHRKELKNRYLDYCRSHGTKPVTRRDFLGAGLLSFSATMTMPTLASLLMPQQAFAQEACPSAAGAANMIPFVTLNLAGGAMLASNYVPMDQGGQPLPTYNKMGLGNGAVPIEREFGNVPFAGNGISKLLTELRNTATNSTLAKTAFVAIPVRSRDDFSMNPFDASGMIAKAGLIGTDLPNLGSNSTITGIRQNYSKVKPPTPLTVRNFTDIEGALGLGRTNGPLSPLEDSQKISLLKLISRLSGSQVEKVNANSGGRVLASLVECATNKNISIAEKPMPDVDVRLDSALANVWGVAQNTNSNDRNVVFGSMVKSSLTGLSGTVSLEQGGYDYHNGTRTTGDQRDGQAGATIGRILESAALLNKPVFIYVTSDGSCVSEISEDRAAPWRSDRGSAGMAFMICFNPAGRPQTNGFQLGAFTSGQAADTNFITGGSPELTAAAVFANYLRLNNRIDLLTPTIGNTFNTNQLDQVIKFG